MASPPKKVNYGLDEKRQAFRAVKNAFEEVKKLDKFPEFDLNKLQSALSMKCGYDKVAHLIDLLSKIPATLPDALRRELYLSFVQESEKDVANDLYIQFASLIRKGLAHESMVFCPPVGICQGCGRSLSRHNDPITVKFFSLLGLSTRKKVNLRCSACRITYQVTRYGKKDAFQMYTEEVPVIEVTDGVLMGRKLFESYCSLHLLSWTTFEGFSASYNTTHDLYGDKNKLISKAYYIGEVESELRRLELVSHTFNDNNLEEVMDLIDEHRCSSIYHHQCTEYCKIKGCEKLHVIDGIWKLVFTTCAMRTENVVNGLPFVRYPDVCTNQPVSRGQAFCQQHKTEMEKVCPTKLNDYLGCAGVKKKDDDSNDAGESDSESEDSTQMKTSLQDKLMHDHPELKKVGGSTISNQGNNKMVREKTDEVAEILLNCEETTTEECNKETGSRGSFNMKSRGYMFIVTAGGFIEMFNPIYKSESPSQAFLTILSFLYVLFENVPEADFDKYWLAYDNMCNVMRMKAAQMDELPLTGKYRTMWNKIHKMIDGLHISNHKRAICRTQLHPDNFKKAYPESRSNTMAAEQLFAWLSRYKKQICCLDKRHQLFMLHRLSVRRNAYTSRCHERKSTPLLPKLKRRMLKTTNDNGNFKTN